jgi:hypothetical protein
MRNGGRNGQANLEPACTRTPIMLDRPAQPALAELQFAVVSLAPPALKRGRVRFEWDVSDAPERQPARTGALTARPRAEVIAAAGHRQHKYRDLQDLDVHDLRLTGTGPDRRSAGTRADVPDRQPAGAWRHRRSTRAYGI